MDSTGLLEKTREGGSHKLIAELTFLKKVAKLGRVENEIEFWTPEPQIMYDTTLIGGANSPKLEAADSHVCLCHLYSYVPTHTHTLLHTLKYALHKLSSQLKLVHTSAFAVVGAGAHWQNHSRKRGMQRKLKQLVSSPPV